MTKIIRRSDKQYCERTQDVITNIHIIVPFSLCLIWGKQWDRPIPGHSYPYILHMARV